MLIVAAVLVAVVLVSRRYGGKAAACGICHEMQPLCESFRASSHNHQAVGECGGCHIGPGVRGSFGALKMGVRDVVAHWVGFDEIRMSPGGLAVVETNCLSCHSKGYTRDRDHLKLGQQDGKSSCTSCHRRSGHEPVGTSGVSPSG